MILQNIVWSWIYHKFIKLTLQVPNGLYMSLDSAGTNIFVIEKSKAPKLSLKS